MKYELKSAVGHTGATVVNLTCPFCRHAGAFHGLPNCHDVTWQTRSPGMRGDVVAQYQGGSRKCPNDGCYALVFVVLRGGKLDESYPPEVIDFDATNLPPRILSTLEEAIKAHGAGCYAATALMVRRLLEELCEDKVAKGDNLKDRLGNLASSVIIPQELLDAADELRLLGNDAAHIEAKAYDKIGQDEAALAIELAKELLKAVYQYASLVSKLKALKKPAAPAK